MFRLAVYTSKQIDLTYLKEPLENEFEVTFINNETSLFALLPSWHPHILIYADANIREDFLQKLNSTLSQLHIALIVMASQYDMRSELIAFQYGADHFLLKSTPFESIKIRLKSLATKNEIHSKRAQNINHISRVTLPSLAKNFKQDDFEVFFEQNLIKIKNSVYRITPTQMKLLSSLIKYAGELLTRDWLIQNIFKDSKTSPRSIDAQIAKLKKSVPPLQPYIINVYGKGYLFSYQKKSAA